MEGVLDERDRVGLGPEASGVALVLGEQQLRLAIAVQAIGAERVVRRLDRIRAHPAQRRATTVHAPRPRVAEPQRRQHPEASGLGPAIVHRDPDEHVFGAALRVLHEHVEVPVFVERPRVQQLVLEVLARTRPVGLDKVPVRVFPLGILVEVLHVGVRGRAVEVEVVLLHVLAVVALAVGQAEQPLLENRVALVPQRQCEAQELLVVADARQTVFAPPVRARARLIVGEVRPRITVVAVVLANRAPLALAEIRSPLLPRNALLAGLVQPRLFDDVGHGGVSSGQSCRGGRAHAGFARSVPCPRSSTRGRTGSPAQRPTTRRRQGCCGRRRSAHAIRARVATPTARRARWHGSGPLLLVDVEPLAAGHGHDGALDAVQNLQHFASPGRWRLQPDGSDDHVGTPKRDPCRDARRRIGPTE